VLLANGSEYRGGFGMENSRRILAESHLTTKKEIQDNIKMDLIKIAHGTGQATCRKARFIISRINYFSSTDKYIFLKVTTHYKLLQVEL
jgi:hypothetical protein